MPLNLLTVASWPLALSALGIADWVYWLIIAAVLLLVEIFSVMLISIWFAVGAVGALVAAMFGASMTVQIIVFVALSVLTFAIGWHFRERIVVGPRRRVPTNADRFIGMEADVIKDLDRISGTGLVRVRGQLWSAESENDELVPAGTRVRVAAIRGVKLIVAPLSADAEG